MTVLMKTRAARRLVAACAIATAIGGGLGLAAAPAGAVRLVGVSAQATGKTGGRPDRIHRAGGLRREPAGSADGAGRSARTSASPTSRTQLTQQGTGRRHHGWSRRPRTTAATVARVRVALASPSAYKVRSARNVIRLELEPEPEATRADAAAARGCARGRAAAGRDADSRPPCAATLLDKVRADAHAHLDDHHARRQRPPDPLVADRVRRSRRAASCSTSRTSRPRLRPRTGVDSVFVKQVRVALNSRDPLVTRVVMEISPSAAYHVERTGPDGRDLAVVFEGREGRRRHPGRAADRQRRRERRQGRRRHDDPRAGDGQRRRDHAEGSDQRAGDARRRRRRRIAQAAPPPTQARVAPPTPQQPPPPAQPQPQPPPPATGQTFSSEVPGQRAEAVHRTSDQLRLRGRRPARRAARVRERERAEHDHRPAGAGARQRPAERRAVGPGARSDPALEQARVHASRATSCASRRWRSSPTSSRSSRSWSTPRRSPASCASGRSRSAMPRLTRSSPLLTKSVLSARGQIQVDARTNTLIIRTCPIGSRRRRR